MEDVFWLYSVVMHSKDAKDRMENSMGGDQTATAGLLPLEELISP